MFKSVRSLKAELSSCLRRVQNGEECLVTLHQTVIARIIPMQSPTQAEHLNRKNFLAELTRNLIKLKKGVKPMSEMVIDQRQNERY